MFNFKGKVAVITGGARGTSKCGIISLLGYGRLYHR